jgi:hypothetical protein
MGAMSDTKLPHGWKPPPGDAGAAAAEPFETQLRNDGVTDVDLTRGPRGGGGGGNGNGNGNGHAGANGHPRLDVPALVDPHGHDVSGNGRRKRIVAVASGGGHWIQLMRMLPAFEHHDVAFVTTLRSHGEQVARHRFYAVADGNRKTKLKLIRMAVRLAWIMLRERPDVVISTGAAPGYFGVRLGRLLGARTIWVDSIANAEHLSMSGEHVGPYADLWLTQWPHLARPEGPLFKGSVL